MFDVFYSGPKPGVLAHERQADNLNHAGQLSRTRYFWWINYLTDYSNFDFLWEPVPWENDARMAWPSQWQKDSETYLVPSPGYTVTNYKTNVVLTRLPDKTPWKIPQTFDQDSFDWSWHPYCDQPAYIHQFGTQHQRTGGPQYCVPGAVDLKFCDQITGNAKHNATAIVEIDHLDGHAGLVPGTVATVRYFDNYRDTLTRIANSCTDEYVWVVSSVCQYDAFDFSWHPEQWQNTMLHVFASSGEKFGDTFYMHVPSFKERIAEFQLLDWYNVNFISVDVPRRPLPLIVHDHDTHVDVVKSTAWSGPLAVFSTGHPVSQVPTVPLWRRQTKTIVPLSLSASVVIVPRTAVADIQTQLYDYAYIDRTQRNWHTDPLLDIVFIDNGESNAEQNWCALQQSVASNGIHRSSGVNGRVAAYHAAAELSTTAWFFAVFAKLQINADFDWSWQPDRMQQPKHYIFHARNPVNGLEYGHMAMIAYNKQLVLNNPGVGLDFTLDNSHEVVSLLSGTAFYTDTAWMAWRTAFRECLKLRASLPDVENQYRLNQWLTKDNTAEQWSQKGAQDAVEYFDTVNGNFAQLRNSYDWVWLAQHARIKRGIVAI